MLPAVDEREDIGPVAQDMETFLTPELAAELVSHLGLPARVVDLLHKVGVGFRHGALKKNRRRRRWRTRDGWTFRERDGKGRTIGLHLRFRDGSKCHRDESSRGLCVPDGVLDSAAEKGYLLLVEGASDVLALLAAEVPAIGRPSCNAGIGHLAVMLADLPDEVQIIVVGENDYKPLTGKWPGRAGAHFTAAKLARQLNRFVHWGVIPGSFRVYTDQSYETLPYKDSRDWLVRKAEGVTGVRRWRSLGKKLLRDIRADLSRCDPQAIAAPVPAHEPKCGRPYRTQLRGRPGGSAADLGAAIDIRCKCWSDEACKVVQQNRHRATNYATLLRWGAPELYQPSLDAPQRSAPDLSGVGPWNLSAAVVSAQQRKALISSLSRLNGRHYQRVYDYRSIAISTTSAASRCWSAICGLGLGYEQIADQHLLWLVVVATAPTVKPPGMLRRVPIADLLALTDAAIVEVPTESYTYEPPDIAEPESEQEADRKQRRQQPVTASPSWRPQDRRTRSGQWLRHRPQPITTAHVRRLAQRLGIADPDRTICDTQDSSVHRSDPVSLDLFSMMVAASNGGTGDEQFVTRFRDWRALLGDAPLGPHVTQLLESRIVHNPVMSDSLNINEARQSDSEEADPWAMRELNGLFKNTLRSQSWAAEIITGERNQLWEWSVPFRTDQRVAECGKRATDAINEYAESHPSVLMELMLPQLRKVVPKLISRQRPARYDYGQSTKPELSQIMKTIAL